MFKNGVNVIKIGENNILQVGEKKPIAALVSKFYSSNPFPNYNDFETIADLIEKVEKNEFTLNLKKCIGHGKNIIEVGSGTSQLSIALASGTNNQIVAFDPTLEALKLGSIFAKKSNIVNCIFVNGDLFSNPFENNYFDVVYCSGVLHHTENPKEGFKIISSWLKNDGYIIIGLYNYYGRLRTILRQKLFKILGRGSLARFLLSFLDPILRQDLSSEKEEAWFNDQYTHPVESLHTFDEVLKWFNDNNIEYISSIPSTDMETLNYKNIFSKKSKGTTFSRIFSQISMLFSRFGSEGGLFLIVGKKLM